MITELFFSALGDHFAPRPPWLVDNNDDGDRPESMKNIDSLRMASMTSAGVHQSRTVTEQSLGGS